MAGFNFRNVGFVGLLSAPPAVTGNRGLQFSSASQHGELADADNALALSGSAWTIEARVQPNANTSGSYVISRDNGAPNYRDVYALIYDFAANRFEFYSFQANSTGGTIRLALVTATPPGAFYRVKFTYDGTTLRAYLNNVLEASLNTSFTLSGVAGQPLRLSQRHDAGFPAPFTIDYLTLTRAGATIVDLQLNEAVAPYANTGTAGGVLTLSSPPPAAVAL